MNDPRPQATAQFLKRHAPFSEMDDASLADLAAHARAERYAKGAVVTSPVEGVARTLYVVREGLVLGRIAGDSLGNPLEFEPGEAFPISAILGRRPTTTRYEAAHDSVCLLVDAETVERVMQTSAPFQRFCTHYMGSLIAQAADRLRQTYGREAAAGGGMLATLGSILRRKPVTCAPQTPLVEALKTMQRNKVSAIVVVEGEREPRGIFTERDLVRHTAAGAVDRDAPISRYMTPDPLGVPVTATAAEAALVMTRHNIRHLLVCDQGGKLAGVVSERSLFALQRLSMREVTHLIEIAEDTDGLRAAAAEIRALAKNMLAQGVGAESLTQLIAALNDKLTERVLELEAARHDLAGIRWCWLALGSEGRHEQTFATDQDNALAFAVEDEAEAPRVRERLLPFAQAVNRTLDACGFPLCKGNVMASNPEWCLSEGEWRQCFGAWIRIPVPQALLNANIFFDFRPLAGDAGIARRLRAWLREGTRDDQRFLRMMAANALQTEPPLGFFGDIVTSGAGGKKGTVDLKAQGSRVITDIARIYALAAGVEASNTAERIRQAGKALRIRDDESEALIDAFYFLLMLRLQHQQAADAAGGEADANRLNPKTLNELDLRILKESFRQARKLQKRLALDYRL